MGCGGCKKNAQRFLETQAKVKKENEEKLARLVATGSIDKIPSTKVILPPPPPTLSLRERVEIRKKRIAQRQERINARNARIAARNAFLQKINPQIPSKTV